MSSADDTINQLLRAQAESTYPSTVIGPKPITLWIPVQVDVADGPFEGQPTHMPVQITTATMRHLAELHYLAVMRDVEIEAEWDNLEMNRGVIADSQQLSALLPRSEHPMNLTVRSLQGMLYWHSEGYELADFDADSEEGFYFPRSMQTIDMEWGLLQAAVDEAVFADVLDVQLNQGETVFVTLMPFVPVPLRVRMGLSSAICKKHDLEHLMSTHSLHTAPADIQEYADLVRLVAYPPLGPSKAGAATEVELLTCYRAAKGIPEGETFRAPTRAEAKQEAAKFLSSIEAVWLQKGPEANPKVDIPLTLETVHSKAPVRKKKPKTEKTSTPSRGGRLLH